MSDLSEMSNQENTNGRGGDVKRGTPPPKSSSPSDTNPLLDIFKILEWLQSPEDFKENLHVLTEKIQKGFASAQLQLSEKDEELQWLRQENGRQRDKKLRLRSQVVAQQHEIAELKVQLDREKWGDGGEDGEVNVSKMREAVKQLHYTFGAMLKAITKTNASVERIQKSPPATPHDLEELQVEVDHLFGKLGRKLKRWERNQKEMQVELGETREVLGSFMAKLMTAREAVGRVKAQAARVALPSKFNSPSPETVDFGKTPSPPPHRERPVLKPTSVIKRAAPASPPPPSHSHTISYLPKDTHQQHLMPAAIPKSSMVETKESSPPVPVMESGRHRSPDLNEYVPNLPQSPYHHNPPKLRRSPPYPDISVQPSTSTSASTPNQMPPPGPPYPCRKCADVFATLVQLRLHSKVIHKDQSASPSVVLLEGSQPDKTASSSKKMKVSVEPAEAELENSSLTLTYHQNIMGYPFSIDRIL